MYLWTFFTDSGTPAIGLSPTVDGYDVADLSMELDGVAMTNVGSTGFYSFDASSLDLSKNIVFLADGGATLSGTDRYKTGGIEEFRALSRNVALENLPFEMVLNTDHTTRATGKTVTARIKKDNGSFAACENAVTETGSGWYTISLTKAERDCKVAVINFSSSGCDDRGIILLSE
jgi:hypothetical protein